MYGSSGRLAVLHGIAHSFVRVAAHSPVPDLDNEFAYFLREFSAQPLGPGESPIGASLLLRMVHTTYQCFESERLHELVSKLPPEEATGAVLVFRHRQTRPVGAPPPVELNEERIQKRKSYAPKASMDHLGSGSSRIF